MSQEHEGGIRRLAFIPCNSIDIRQRTLEFVTDARMNAAYNITKYNVDGSVMVWGNMSLEGQRHLHITARGTLTAVWYLN